MYQAIDDPYCYRGTNVLKNRLGLRDQAVLDEFEAEATAQRFAEPFPPGRFTVSHYRAVHRHIFGDVFPWAGRYRSVRIAKGRSMFCYPEHIPAELALVFRERPGLAALRTASTPEFAAAAAHFLAELNAIHPFRDGNGQTQLAFLTLLADQVGHPLNLDGIKPDAFLDAMIGSFHGRERPLAHLIEDLLR